MTKITAVIIAFNEEKHIGKCIDSLQGIAEQIIVVDSFSADKTKEIAEQKKAWVIQKEFEGFGAQKNFGAGLAVNNYILSIDADEALSGTLQNSILQLKNGQIKGAYKVHRLNFIGNTAVKSSGWYPDPRIRLYNKLQAHWDNKIVHEELITTDEISFLEGDLLHYTYENYNDMKIRTTRYAKLGAQAYKHKNKLALLLKMLANPVAKFIKTYFLEKGFTDGFTGWVIAIYKTRETFLKYYWALV